MKFLTHRRLVPIAYLIVMCGFLLASLFLLLDATTPAHIPVEKSSPKVYGLVDVGKWKNSVPHEKHREGQREWFTDTDGMPWYSLRVSPAANLGVVLAQKDARSWLSKVLHADYLGKTDLLRIWLADGSPHEQAVIVDTIIRGYLQDIEQNRVPYLKLGLAVARRTLAACTASIVDAETRLRELDNAVSPNMDEVEYFWIVRNALEKNLEAAKKGVTPNRASIENDEEALRTLPHIVKWAGKPRPEE